MVIEHPDDRRVIYHVRHTAGIDVGRLCDRTALAVVETHKPMPAIPDHPAFVKAAKEVPTKHYLRGLERFPEGQSFRKQVPRLLELLRNPKLQGLRVFMDRNGMGVGIYDDLKAAKLANLSGVAITSATSPPKQDEMGWCVGKSELVNRPLILLQSEELVFERTLANIRMLEHEMKEFKATITKNGHTDYNAASGEHDDLVIAVCLAVFGARRPAPVTRIDMRFAS